MNLRPNFDDVGDFHDKFGLDSSTHRGSGPRDIDSELLLFRLNFMLEELLELAQAVGAELQHIDQFEWREVATPRIVLTDDWEESQVDHAAVFDALMDEAYVTFGLAQLLGYPWQAGWNMVQAANMAKERAERAEQSERGGTWDVIKPEGWKPPDIEGLLYAQGWNIPKFSMPSNDLQDDEDQK